MALEAVRAEVRRAPHRSPSPKRKEPKGKCGLAIIYAKVVAGSHFGRSVAISDPSGHALDYAPAVGDSTLENDRTVVYNIHFAEVRFLVVCCGA